MSPTTAPKEVMQTLEKIFQAEIAGVMRYLHYSFMIVGHNRIPIQKWFRDQASESEAHTIAIGEKITSLGGHPPMVTASVEESHNHDVNHILKECLASEEQALDLYKQLVSQAAEIKDIALEELARSMVREETEHCDEVRKMLRSPR